MSTEISPLVTYLLLLSDVASSTVGKNIIWSLWLSSFSQGWLDRLQDSSCSARIFKQKRYFKKKFTTLRKHIQEEKTVELVLFYSEGLSRLKFLELGKEKPETGKYI